MMMIAVNAPEYANWKWIMSFKMARGLKFPLELEVERDMV